MRILATERQEAIYSLLREGASVRRIVKELQIAKRTVLRYRKLLILSGWIVPLCFCRQPVSHKGWCSLRYTKSERRQEVMRRLHLPGRTKGPLKETHIYKVRCGDLKTKIETEETNLDKVVALAIVKYQPKQLGTFFGVKEMGKGPMLWGITEWVMKYLKRELRNEIPQS